MDDSRQSAGDAVRERLKLHADLPNPSERRRIRESAGLTAREVAAAVGASHQAILMWEQGQRSPRGDFLVRYVEALNAMREATA